MKEFWFKGIAVEDADWNEEYGDWYEGNLIYKLDAGLKLHAYISPTDHPRNTKSTGAYVHKNTICWFIGRYDINGKKLFTGDIVKHGKDKYVIEFDHENLCIYFVSMKTKEKKDGSWHIENRIPFEVVGNVYEKRVK